MLYKTCYFFQNWSNCRFIRGIVVKLLLCGIIVACGGIRNPAPKLGCRILVPAVSLMSRSLHQIPVSLVHFLREILFGFMMRRHANRIRRRLLILLLVLVLGLNGGALRIGLLNHPVKHIVVLVAHAIEEVLEQFAQVRNIGLLLELERPAVAEIESNFLRQILG